MFPCLMQFPAQFDHFFNMLQGWRVDRPGWFDVYLVEPQLLSYFSTNDESDSLLVDIGGATSYDIQNFKQAFEKKGHYISGRLIVQDLSFVINDIKELDAGIERMPYDFFILQPIVAAKAYYLRSICHD